MEEKLNKLLEMLIQGAEKGAQLASDNAAPLFEEYYKYKMAGDIISVVEYTIILLIATAAIVRLGPYFLKKHKERERDSSYDETYMAYYFITIIPSVMIGITSFFILLGSSERVILGVVAPKAYTIQAIKSDLLSDKRCGGNK